MYLFKTYNRYVLTYLYMLIIVNRLDGVFEKYTLHGNICV